jgi:hypothetical protein
MNLQHQATRSRHGGVGEDVVGTSWHTTAQERSDLVTCTLSYITYIMRKLEGFVNEAPTKMAAPP